MVDPVSGKVAGAAAPTSAESMDALKETGDAEKTDGKSFKDVLNGDEKQVDGAQEANEVQQTEQVQETQKIDELEGADGARSRVDNFVKDVLNDEKKLDRAMQRAVDGASMDQGELLKLQATMYGYAQKVDLATKVVEKTTGGVKQMMNTQV